MLPSIIPTLSWLQWCRLGWWPWWVQVYFRLSFPPNDGVITWWSKKQTCVALSTIDAEYIACSAAIQEGVWLKRFLREFDIVVRTEERVTIYCDSSTAIACTKDPKYHGKIKHIDIRYHFIRHMIARKEVILRHISTIRMVVDPLTKPYLLMFIRLMSGV